MTASLLVVLKWTVALLILAIGTDSSLSDLTYLWRRPALLVRSLLAMYVVVPLIALVIVRSFALPTGVNLALLVLAVSAGAPLLPRKLMRMGDGAYVFSLVVSSSLLSIVTVPAWVGILAPMFGKTSTLTAGDVAPVIWLSFLAPLLLGMGLRATAPTVAAWFGDRLMMIGGSVLAVTGLLLLIDQRAAIVAAGWPTLLPLAGMSLLALATGHLFGGPSSDDRTTLALSCATRHVGLAVLIAAAVPETLTATLVVVYLIASAVVSLPYLRWRARSSVAPATV